MSYIAGLMTSPSHAVVASTGKKITKACSYGELKALLVHYHFAPGSRLEIASLAKRFNTSPTPVREALQRLHAEGFLDLQPGRGYFAKAFSLREMTNLYDFGHVLLRHAIVRAINTFTPAILDALLANLPHLSNSNRNDVKSLTITIERTLEKLVTLVQNEVLISAFRNFLERTRYTRALILREPVNAQEYIHDLEALIEQIRNRDSAAAISVWDECRKWKLRQLPGFIKEAISRHYV